jgi:hypothetical protein
LQKEVAEPGAAIIKINERQIKRAVDAVGEAIDKHAVADFSSFETEIGLVSGEDVSRVVDGNPDVPSSAPSS